MLLLEFLGAKFEEESHVLPKIWISMRHTDGLVEDAFGEEFANECIVGSGFRFANLRQTSEADHFLATRAGKVLREILHVESAEAVVMRLNSEAFRLEFGDAFEDVLVRHFAEPADDHVLFFRRKITKNIVWTDFPEGSFVCVLDL